MSSKALPILTLLTGGLAGLFGNRGRNQTTTTRRTEDTDILTSPVYDPKLGAVRDILLNTLVSRMEDEPNFWDRYLSQGLANINQGIDINRQALENLLSQRGLSRSPASILPLMNLESQRLAQQNQFLGQLPMLRDQRQMDTINALARFITSLPVGEQRIGRSSSTGTETGRVSGNPLGGSLGTLATLLAMLWGRKD